MNASILATAAAAFPKEIVDRNGRAFSKPLQARFWEWPYANRSTPLAIVSAKVVALAGGPLLGAKLFDLIVLDGAWSAFPSASLAMMPYVKEWPVDTGVFFISLSAAMLLAGFGALVAGWGTPWRYRWLLCLPSIGILLLLILTVAAFWPMNAALYYHGIGSPKDTNTDAQSVAMVRRWVALDWVCVAGATAVFVAPMRALTLPWPPEVARQDPPLVRALLALALLGVAKFVIWFVLNL